MKRIDVALAMRETGAILLYYNPDIQICKEVISACYRGGLNIFEFTNRGEFAHKLFGKLAKWARKERDYAQLERLSKKSVEIIKRVRSQSPN